MSQHWRWSQGHKVQGQGQTLSRPRPRTKDTDASVPPPQTKRSLKFFFRRSQKKKVFKNFFQAKKVSKNFFSGDLYLRKPKKRSLQIFRKVSGVFQQNFNGSKIVLSLSRGQGNFRGLEAEAKDFKMCPRGQGLLKDSTSGQHNNRLNKMRVVFAHRIKCGKDCS